MNKKSLNYLKRAAQTPPTETEIVPHNVARQLPILFGFKHLDLDRDPFECTSGHGEQLIYTLKTLSHFSKVVREQMHTFPNCHEVPDGLIKKHSLENFVDLSPSKKMHQLGRSRTPERIVGFYDKQINLFQVCLLDLSHELSGN